MKDRSFKASFKYQNLIFGDVGEFSWTITALRKEFAVASAEWTMFEFTLKDPKESEKTKPFKTWGLKVAEIL